MEATVQMSKVETDVREFINARAEKAIADFFQSNGIACSAVETTQFIAARHSNLFLMTLSYQIVRSLVTSCLMLIFQLLRIFQKGGNVITLEELVAEAETEAILISQHF